MKGKSVVIIGATSSIARALGIDLANQGASLYLMARDAFELERIAQDIAIRYQVKVFWGVLEAQNYDQHSLLIDQIRGKLDSIDGIIVSLGELGNQQTAQSNFNEAQRIIHSNYTGVASILSYFANYLENQKQGFIVGISSVAGDRGRQSNYIYGSAKGALSLYLQGLRSRLSKSNVHVMTVKPGFVDTKMTFGMSGLFLVASPDSIATGIIKALEKQKNIVYLPSFWWLIMTIIKLIPEFIFKKMKL